MVLAKDYLMLLDAFALVAARLPEAELHFAGGGPMLERVRQRIGDLGLGNRIVMHGPIFDMPGYMASLDAFVLSSLTEGLPIVILEAMAAGLPIVSTRVAGVPEAAPENEVARYVPIGDAAAFAEAMIATAGDPDLEAIGQNGRCLAQTRFTIEHTWQEHERLFEALLGGSARKDV
jgi:glycosyltransferase involved in cell wall biosynthesis